MSENRAFLTESIVEAGLRELGVRPGGVLVVHASMSRLGYVLGGAPAILAALRAVLGDEGTLMVPAFTADRTDPSCWVDPPLPELAWEPVRAEMSPFDPVRSLPLRMGQLSTAVLLEPQARRSSHPLCSWLALGPRAEELVAAHDLADPFGPESPLARAVAAGAQVLLLGVDQRSNSAMMHAHVLADPPHLREGNGSFLVEEDGQRRWQPLTRFVDCTEGYGRLEHELVASGLIRVQRIGDSDCRLMEMHAFVPAVRHVLAMHPERVACGRPGCRTCGRIGQHTGGAPAEL